MQPAAFIRTNVFSISVITAVVSFIVLTTLATLFATDYDFISETISALGTANQKHSWILFLSGTIYSVFIQGLIPLFYVSSKSIETKITNSALILFYGLTGLGTSFFKVGNYNYIVGDFTEDRVHEILARLSFYSIWVLIALSPITFKRIDQFSLMKTFSVFVTPIVFITGIIFELNLQPEYRGLYQRFLFIIVMIWIILATQASQNLFSETFKPRGNANG